MRLPSTELILFLKSSCSKHVNCGYMYGHSDSWYNSRFNSPLIHIPLNTLHRPPCISLMTNSDFSLFLSTTKIISLPLIRWFVDLAKILVVERTVTNTMKASKVNRYGEKQAFLGTKEDVRDERGWFISTI